MKKLLSLLLVFAFVVTSGVLFSACELKAPVDVKIGEETYSYKTLNEAIRTETVEGIIEITLNKNLVLDEAIDLTKNEYVLNLNGHKISFPTNQATALIRVQDTAKLTINGDGIIDSASQNNDYSIAIWARNGGEVILNGGTYTNVGARAFEEDGTSPNNNELIYASGTGSSIVINGGTYIGNYENTTWGTRYTLNIHDKDASSFVVKGGEFRQYDPANSLSENPKGNFVDSGYVSTVETRNGVQWFVVSAE